MPLTRPRNSQNSRAFPIWIAATMAAVAVLAIAAIWLALRRRRLRTGR